MLAIDHDKRRLSLSLGKSEGGTAEDVAEAPKAPARLGTFGDLFKKR